jgi:glycine hydroxymethyltransferase
LADIAHEAGLVIGGANKSPFPYADVVTMTTHKTLRGPRGAIIICRKELAEAIDFSVFPGLQGGPHMHTIAGIAIALENAVTPQFKKYAMQTVKNAKYLAKRFVQAGLDVVSGGTEKHLVLVDLGKSGTNGAIVAYAHEVAGIIINKNTVPNEFMPPFYPSGIRFGTPAITVRGMKEKEMDKIAGWMLRIIEYVTPYKLPQKPEARSVFMKAFREKMDKDKLLLGISEEVKELCSKFPVP